MDTLAGLLDGPRARGAFVLRSVLTAPWSIRIEDQAPLTLVAMVRGAAWFLGDGEAPIRLEGGDIAIVRGPDPYTVADDPDTPVGIVIHPGQRCTSIDGREVPFPSGLGVRTWGNDPDGETMMLTGTYHLPGEISGRVLAALPSLVVLRQGEWDSHLVALLREEIGRDAPGQEAVLDRLLDLVLIAALRSWFSRPEADTPGWFLAQSDPVVGGVLRLLQEHPSHAWTLNSLAAEAHVSRAALARRFKDLVGEPPMTYLTGWRLALAADLLAEPGATIAEVAQQVGYGGPFALSTAFKRVRGVSPKAHRARNAS